jgi:hypothetical protein
VSTRLRSFSKLSKGDQEAELTVHGLLVALEGDPPKGETEPFFILRASDPAAARALALYINEATDRDAEDVIIEHAKQTLTLFNRWARECGTIRQTDAPYHKDYLVKEEPRLEGATQPQAPTVAQATQKKPGKKK